MALGARAALSTVGRTPAGMPVSDQYVKLQEEREHRQRPEKDRRRRKKKDKDKRGKPRRHSSLHTESDEDIAPAQRVDIVTEEMPEVGPPGPRRAGSGSPPRAGIPRAPVPLRGHARAGLPVTGVLGGPLASRPLACGVPVGAGGFADPGGLGPDGLDALSLSPQNALPSDEDDKDPNDPYRALDVDLDR